MGLWLPIRTSLALVILPFFSLSLDEELYAKLVQRQNRVVR